MTNTKLKSFLITFTLDNSREIKNQITIYKKYVQFLIIKMNKKIENLFAVLEFGKLGTSPHLHVWLCLKKGVKKQDAKAQYLTKWIKTNVDSSPINSSNPNHEYDYHCHQRNTFKIANNVPMLLEEYTQKEDNFQVLYDSLSIEEHNKMKEEATEWKSKNEHKKLQAERFKHKTLNRSQFPQLLLTRIIARLDSEYGDEVFSKELFANEVVQLGKEYLYINSFRELPTIYKCFKIRFSKRPAAAVQIIMDELNFCT